MAKGRRTRARGASTGRTGGTGRRGTSAPAGSPAPIRTIGIDPSWFTIRGQDTRGSVVQLASVAGLALGLFVALDRFGSTAIGGSEQTTQFAWLASVVGLAALPVAAAAGSDAGITWLARRGVIAPATLERAALLMPPIVALVAGVLLPPLLFTIGGQMLYLGMAGVVLVIVVAAIAVGYLRRWFATAGDTSGPQGDGA